MPQGLKITFLIHAIVVLVFGVVMYLIPGMWATLVNWVPFDPGMPWGYGAAMLALAISSWLGYRAVRLGAGADRRPDGNRFHRAGHTGRLV